uniref:Uncharacterized protein n=1 Tax=viral metagenome TaxID=1070528 RepID=A0A6C0BKQ7_9ZZZZ
MSYMLVNGYLFSCGDISVVRSSINTSMHCVPDMNSRAINLLNNSGIRTREVIFKQVPTKLDDQSILLSVDVELSTASSSI